MFKKDKTSNAIKNCHRILKRIKNAFSSMADRV